MTMTVAVTDPMALVGFVAFDRDGEQLGEVEGVYMGPEAPEWAALLLPNGRFVVVPLAEAEVYEDSLDLPFTTAEVYGAPLQRRQLLEDLTESQETQLSAYFSGLGEPGSPVAEVASTAKAQGRQVASTAVDRSQQVAATAKQQSQRVAEAADGNPAAGAAASSCHRPTMGERHVGAVPDSTTNPVNW